MNVPGAFIVRSSIMNHRIDAPAYTSFSEFYPHYLDEHRNRTCRRLHFFGSLGALGCLGMAIATLHWVWLPLALLCGYGCAWIGHLAFEKNRPATFRHPFYSLLGDWAMFSDICRGRMPL
jgi:hypothetical protein